MTRHALVTALALVGIGFIIYGVATSERNRPSPTAEGQNTGAASTEQEEPLMQDKNPVVVLKTNKGDITLELFVDKTPITTGNFLKLVEEGFYNETKLHRVIDGFMIQGGDPNSKSDDTSRYGQGGPGYTIEDEFAEGLSNVRGTISMANTGAPNSGGSQFFINLVDNVGLDYDKEPFGSKHPVFGKVTDGMEVILAIGKTPTGARDIPLEPVVINEALVLE